MALDGQNSKWQIVATEDLLTGAMHKAVVVGGTLAQAGSSTYPMPPFGILKSQGKSGEQVAVAVEGFVKAFVGGAVNTLGWPLVAANSGFLVAGSYASAGSSQYPVVGRLVGPGAAASGDLATIFLTP